MFNSIKAHIVLSIAILALLGRYAIAETTDAGLKELYSKVLDAPLKYVELAFTDKSTRMAVRVMHDPKIRIEPATLEPDQFSSVTREGKIIVTRLAPRKWKEYSDLCGDQKDPEGPGPKRLAARVAITLFEADTQAQSAPRHIAVDSVSLAIATLGFIEDTFMLPRVSGQWVWTTGAMRFPIFLGADGDDTWRSIKRPVVEVPELPDGSFWQKAVDALRTCEGDTRKDDLKDYPVPWQDAIDRAELQQAMLNPTPPPTVEERCKEFFNLAEQIAKVG